MLGKKEGRNRRRHQRMRWLDGTIDAMDMNLGKLQEMVRDRAGLFVKGAVLIVKLVRVFVLNYVT